MSGAVTERGTARPPKLAQLPPAGASGAVTARSAFAKACGLGGYRGRPISTSFTNVVEYSRHLDSNPAATSTAAQRTIDEAGINYLKGAKVGSVKGYLMVSGTILGKPHTSSRPGSSTPRPRTRFDSISEMAAGFREMPYCYASMDRKPLMPYTPNAFRSRLAVDDAPVPYKNASTIEFNDGIHTCHKRRFQTTNATVYTGEPCDPRSNQGVIAAQTRFRKFMQAK